MRYDPPFRDQRFGKLLRNFGLDLRDYLYSLPAEPGREVAVNRYLSTVAGLTGVAMTLRPNRRTDPVAAALLATAVRLWTLGSEQER